MRLLWLLMACALATALAHMHIAALESYLYWRYVWLDVPVHLLGGLTLAMLVIGVLKVFRPWFFMAAIAVLIIGWEGFELAIGTGREANYVFDTTLDILMGALGAVIAYFLARLTLWRSA